MLEPLPLFPLPDVVLLPGGYLPLRIFEARYRCMVRDLADHPLLVMGVLATGWQATYHAAPPVHSTACLAEMIACEEHADGRFAIVVRGRDRVVLLDELRDRPYRRVLARVLPSHGEVADEDRDLLLELLQSLLSRLSAQLPPAFLERLDATIDAGALADTVAHVLALPPRQKREFLEEPDRVRRVRSLCGCLGEMARRLEER